MLCSIRLAINRTMPGSGSLAAACSTRAWSLSPGLLGREVSGGFVHLEGVEPVLQIGAP
jgi:hypothetical protein